MIGFDLDGVICDTYSVLRNQIKFRTKHDIHKEPQKYFKINIPMHTDLEVGNLINTIILENSDEIQFLPNAKEYLVKIHRLIKYPICFITAREHFLTTVTRKWLDDNLSGTGVKFKVFFCKSKFKVAHCKDLGLKYFVEDKPFTIDELSEHIHKVYVINQEWNLSWKPKRKNVVRLDSLREVYYHFGREENLICEKDIPKEKPTNNEVVYTQGLLF